MWAAVERKMASQKPLTGVTGTVAFGAAHLATGVYANSM